MSLMFIKISIFCEINDGLQSVYTVVYYPFKYRHYLTHDKIMVKSLLLWGEYIHSVKVIDFKEYEGI